MPKCAFLFAGQGAQAVGMGREIFDRHEPSRGLFLKAGEILGFDLAKTCFEGPAETLNRSDICQPALLVAALAALEYDSSRRRTPVSYAAGLSLGEYTALVAAGALEFAEALSLVRRRGIYMQEACESVPGGMASVLALDLDKIQEACREAGGVVTVSNVNAPGQVVISGESAALERASERCLKAGAKRVVRLKVAGAYHSPLMKEAEEKMGPLLDRAHFRRAQIPIVSNIDGRTRDEPAELRDALKRQITGTVQWVRTIETLKAFGVETYVEYGPGRVLSGLVGRIDSGAKCRSVEKAADVA